MKRDKSKGIGETKKETERRREEGFKKGGGGGAMDNVLRGIQEYHLGVFWNSRLVNISTPLTHVLQVLWIFDVMDSGFC